LIARHQGSERFNISFFSELFERSLDFKRELKNKSRERIKGQREYVDTKSTYLENSMTCYQHIQNDKPVSERTNEQEKQIKHGERPCD
jgi:hypothetical protein